MSNSQTASPADSAPQSATSPGAVQRHGKSKSKGRRRRPQPAARPGSKKAAVIAMLKRPKGATLEDLVKATGWQAHSVRGFLSGSLRKSLGLKIKSSKNAGGQRAYQLKAGVDDVAEQAVERLFGDRPSWVMPATLAGRVLAFPTTPVELLNNGGQVPVVEKQSKDLLHACFLGLVYHQAAS